MFSPFNKFCQPLYSFSCFYLFLMIYYINNHFILSFLFLMFPCFFNNFFHFFLQGISASLIYMFDNFSYDFLLFL